VKYFSNIFQNGYDPKYPPISEQIAEAIEVIFKADPPPPSPPPPTPAQPAAKEQKNANKKGESSKIYLSLYVNLQKFICHFIVLESRPSLPQPRGLVRSNTR
jgi:hypothetical protein